MTLLCSPEYNMNQEYPKVLKYWDTKTTNFPFVPVGNFNGFRCPNI